MKTKISIVILLLLAGFSKSSFAQQPSLAGPSDTLAVVWTS
jgi:hypothetical protein